MRSHFCTTVGIDEAGRGPLAGPVSVAVFGVSAPRSIKKLKERMLDRFPTGRDSKKMSEKEREEWFGVFEEERKKGNIFFEVGFSTAAYIDEKGIVPAIRNAMEKCLKKMEREVVIESGKTHLLLDGALRAPVRFVSQQTIIKGDEKEKLIACASIVAKVSRDRLMKKISRKHPEYLFEIHKGYGTANHRKLIKKYGLSEIHRKSFCRLS